jgi:16S rRNA processing protein RimM
MASVPLPLPGLTPSALPEDAVEIGRLLGPWGVKGWLKILPHGSEPEALLSARAWFLQAPDAAFRGRFSAFSGTVSIEVLEAKVHSDSIVARLAGVEDRTAAEALKGARILLPRSSFAQPAQDEYYWVDLIGLDVVNREGVALGRVRDLMATGPQSVLCVEYAAESAEGAQMLERMIPFVSAYIDAVDLPGRLIKVDWQLDY